MGSWLVGQRMARAEMNTEISKQSSRRSARKARRRVKAEVLQCPPLRLLLPARTAGAPVLGTGTARHGDVSLSVTERSGLIELDCKEFEELQLKAEVQKCDQLECSPIIFHSVSKDLLDGQDNVSPGWCSPAGTCCNSELRRGQQGSWQASYLRRTASSLLSKSACSLLAPTSLERGV